MIRSRRPTTAMAVGLMLAVSPLATGSAIAQPPVFGALDPAAKPSVQFSAQEERAPIVAGDEVTITGTGFEPNQRVHIHYGTTPLMRQPLVADAEGAISGTMTVPADATVGIHPIIVSAEAPYQAMIAELTVAPDLPLSGQSAFEITTSAPVRGLYQSAYSAANDTIFLTSAIGRPPVHESEVVKVDADTLDVLARTTPNTAPQREGRDGTMQDGGLFAVYGVAVDDRNGNVWVTNSRQDTVAVYRQSDLALVKQFAPGTVDHSRDVRIDEELGKAYASATFTPEVVVFDTASLEETGRITIPSSMRRETFGTASLSLDPTAHRLYVAGLDTNEVAVIDTRTDDVLNVFPVPGARGLIGIGHDPQTGNIYASMRDSNNLVVLDGDTGEVIADTPTGAGAINVAFEPMSRRAFVSNRGSGTITVTDADGNIVANLGPAPLANHVSVGPDGTIYAVDKSARSLDAEGDRLLRIRPAN